MKILNGKGIFALLLTVMLGVSTSVSAYPLLTFNAINDGTGTSGLSFDSVTNELSILGTLTGSYDIATPVNFDGSSVVLTATFDAATGAVESSGYTFAGFNAGSLSIIDGDTTTLLDGSLTNLFMYGVTNDDQATLVADFGVADGSLSSEFQNIADLFALELNLSTLFNATIFESRFTADVYGTVSSDAVSVPEPGVLFLFAAGLLMLGFTSSRKTIS